MSAGPSGPPIRYPTTAGRTTTPPEAGLASTPQQLSSARSRETRRAPVLVHPALLQTGTTSLAAVHGEQLYPRVGSVNATRALPVHREGSWKVNQVPSDPRR